MNRCNVIDLLEDNYGLNKDELTKRELAIIGLCTKELSFADNGELNLHPVLKCTCFAFCMTDECYQKGCKKDRRYV
jgi:hypothetical protein